jgi:hypothetical protein
VGGYIGGVAADNLYHTFIHAIAPQYDDPGVMNNSGRSVALVADGAPSGCKIPRPDPKKTFTPQDVFFGECQHMYTDR